MRFGIRIQRLADLLRPRETAAEREALTEGIPFGVGLPHQDAAQIGVASERDAEHVEHFPLEPVGAVPELPHRVNPELLGRIELDFDPNVRASLEGAQEIDDFERAFAVAVFDRRDVHEIVELLLRRVLEPGHHLE